jgi:hypothetical protein
MGTPEQRCRMGQPSVYPQMKKLILLAVLAAAVIFLKFGIYDYYRNVQP